MSKGPLVRKRPRARNKDGTWRKKRSDAGKKRESEKTNMDNIVERVKKLEDIGLLSHVSPDAPVSDSIANTTMPETVILLHIEAQTHLLLEILDTLQMMDGRLATLESNSEDEWNRQHNK